MNATEGGGPSSKGLDKDKGKRKLDNDSGNARKRWKDPKFSTYTGLNETLERIYRILEITFPTGGRLGENQQNEKEHQEGTVSSMIWMDTIPIAAGN